MNSIAKKIIAFTFFIVISLSLKAQKSNETNYLYHIGTKDGLYSEILGEQRDIWLHVPPDAKPYERFPVVYVLDGGEQMRALTTVYDYYWGNYLPKMILVGIANRENRTRDLTTSDVKIPNLESGGAEKFTAFIEKELIPYIDKKYPTTPYRTLIGHSHAGLFTLNMLINHKDVFKNYIAIEPSLYWDDQKFLKSALSKLKKEDYTGKSLFLSMASPLDRSDESIGIEEVMNNPSENSVLAHGILTLAKAAEKNANHGLRSSWKYYPDDLHGTLPLPSMIDGLRFMFEWYQLKDASKYNTPETPIC